MAEFLASAPFWQGVAFFVTLGIFMVFRKKIVRFLDSHAHKIREAAHNSSMAHEREMDLYSGMEDKLKRAEEVINNMFVDARSKLEYLEAKREKEHKLLQDSQEKLLNHMKELLREKSKNKLRSYTILELAGVLEERLKEEPLPLEQYIKGFHGLKI